MENIRDRIDEVCEMGLELKAFEKEVTEQINKLKEDLKRKKEHYAHARRAVICNLPEMSLNSKIEGNNHFVTFEKIPYIKEPTHCFRTSKDHVFSKYSLEFKLRALELVSKIGYLKAAKELNIPNQTLFNWIQKNMKGELGDPSLTKGFTQNPRKASSLRAEIKARV